MTDANNTDANNVLAFAPRPAPPPEPERMAFEFFLRNEDGAIFVTLRDRAGNIFPLEYKLVGQPADFDISRLLAAWDNLRGTMGTAS